MRQCFIIKQEYNDTRPVNIGYIEARFHQFIYTSEEVVAVIEYLDGTVDTTPLHLLKMGKIEDETVLSKELEDHIRSVFNDMLYHFTVMCNRIPS